jgi:hypothetical protein
VLESRGLERNRGRRGLLCCQLTCDQVGFSFSSVLPSSIMVRGPHKRGSGAAGSARGRGGSSVPRGGVQSAPAGSDSRGGRGAVTGRGSTGRVATAGRGATGRGGVGPKSNSRQAQSEFTPEPTEESTQTVPTARSEYLP